MSFRRSRSSRLRRFLPFLPFLPFLLLAPAALSLSACTYVSTRSLEYTPIPAAVSALPAGSLAVHPLEEARGPREYHSLTARMFLTYVPLLPYVRVPFERLDEIDVAHQSAKGGRAAPDRVFTETFARAIAADLRGSSLFTEVTFISDAAPAATSDYILKGELRSSRFEKTFTSYLLGMAGVLLWLLPIPLGSDAACVDVELRLHDASGREVWSHRIEEQETRWYTFYNSGGAPVTSRFSLEIKRYGSNDAGIDGDSLWAYHAAALRQGMEGAKISLSRFLASRGTQSEVPMPARE